MQITLKKQQSQVVEKESTRRCSFKKEGQGHALYEERCGCDCCTSTSRVRVMNSYLIHEIGVAIVLKDGRPKAPSVWVCLNTSLLVGHSLGR